MNEFYRMIRMGVAEVTEQRSMNNEYGNAQISKLSPVNLTMGIYIYFEKFMVILAG